MSGHTSATRLGQAGPVRVAVTVAALLLAAGCGAPDAETSEQTADEMRTEVRETLSAVAEGLRERGIEVTEATGEYEACGLKSAQLGYGAGMGTTAASGSVADQLAAAREVIEGLDLPMQEIEGVDDVSTDPAESDLRVSAKESRVEPGTLTVEVVRDCEELDADVVDEHLNEEPETLTP